MDEHTTSHEEKSSQLRKWLTRLLRSVGILKKPEEYPWLFYVAEIPNGHRKRGMRWLLLDIGPSADGAVSSSRLVDLYVFGPHGLMLHGPRAGKAAVRFGTIRDAHQAATGDWGVAPEGWVATPKLIDLHGSLRLCGEVLVDASLAAEFSWKPLSEPNHLHDCLICNRSYDEDREPIPMTHVAGPSENAPPLPPNREYPQMCRLCYARFIARDGLTELMEQLLRGETPK